MNTLCFFKHLEQERIRTTADQRYDEDPWDAGIASRLFVVSGSA